jgi:hypothetical protein
VLRVQVLIWICRLLLGANRGRRQERQKLAAAAAAAAAVAVTVVIPAPAGVGVDVGVNVGGRRDHCSSGGAAALIAVAAVFVLRGFDGETVPTCVALRRVRDRGGKQIRPQRRRLQQRESVRRGSGRREHSGEGGGGRGGGGGGRLR